MFEQLGLVGCGLMGGSFALALKKAGLVKHIIGYSPSATSREQALALGVIDASADTPQGACKGADIVLVAVPVAATQATLMAVRGQLSDSTLVMDVGSTKQDVIAAATMALGKKIINFVPAHPIAGKEVAGVTHADAQLYQDCQVILTPTAATLPAHILQAQQVWQALGSRVVKMSPLEHDQAFAAVSHLPHLLAFAAVNAITQQSNGTALLQLAGSGFRDFSRIAGGDSKVWRDIFLANKTQLLDQLQQFEAQAQAIVQAIEKNDAVTLDALIASASQTRLAWRIGEGVVDV